MCALARRPISTRAFCRSPAEFGYILTPFPLLDRFRYRSIAPPDDLAVWYGGEVAVNRIDDQSCPFGCGPIRSLEQRVADAHRLGAIACIPSKAKKWDPNGPYQSRRNTAVKVEW